MAANSRFAVATHLLTALAFLERADPPGVPASSESLARSVSTNAVVVRRLLGQLQAAGLVTSLPGRHGGSSLARPAARITLRDVHRAVDEGCPLGPSANEPDASCPVGRCIGSLLDEVLAGVHAAVEGELGKTTLADLADRVARRQRG
jgi:Rrf2 family protein